MRYQRRIRTDAAQVRERLWMLAAERRHWGYRRLYLLLKREPGRINHKRVQCLYRLEGLAIRQRKRKRVAGIPRGVRVVKEQPGEAWGMGFMQVCAGCPRRQAPLPDAECARYRHARMSGDCGGHLVAWPAPRAAAGSTHPLARLVWHPQTNYPRTPGHMMLDTSAVGRDPVSATVEQPGGVLFWHSPVCFCDTETTGCGASGSARLGSTGTVFRQSAAHGGPPCSPCTAIKRPSGCMATSTVNLGRVSVLQEIVVRAGNVKASGARAILQARYEHDDAYPEASARRLPHASRRSH